MKIYTPQSMIYATAVSTALAFIPTKVLAHCPLCVGGAGAAAGIATLLGVSYSASGVFIGAFVTAMALWAPRLIKRTFIPHQYLLLFLVMYLTTILPLVPFLKDYGSIYISLSGEYGSLLNRTYLINWFIIGSALGTLLIFLAPILSKKLSKLRGGRIIKFQGLIITFLLLSITAVGMQIIR